MTYIIIKYDLGRVLDYTLHRFIAARQSGAIIKRIDLNSS